MTDIRLDPEKSKETNMKCPKCESDNWETGTLSRAAFCIDCKHTWVVHTIEWSDQAGTTTAYFPSYDLASNAASVPGRHLAGWDGQPVKLTCGDCGQSPDGQTGEYRCPACGVPTLHDAPTVSVEP